MKAFGFARHRSFTRQGGSVRRGNASFGSVGFVLAVLLAVVMLAGCGGSSPSSGGGGSQDSGTSSSDSGSGAGDSASAGDSSAADSSPAAEGSGPESPQQKQQGGPSITVASLPVGGSATPDASDPDQQCGSVNWLLGSIPADVTVTIGDVSLDPSGIFTVGGSACGSDQTACTSGLTWTTDHSGCSVPLTQTDPTSDATVTLGVPGVISCPTQSVCDDLSGQLGDLSGSHSQATVTAVPHTSSDSSESSSPSSDPSDGGSDTGSASTQPSGS